jgi:hypothetical protein
MQNAHLLIEENRRKIEILGIEFEPNVPKQVKRYMTSLFC